MSAQIITLKDRADFWKSSRILATENAFELRPGAPASPDILLHTWSSICTQTGSAEGDDRAQAIAGGGKEVAY
jgi:hypothetical protein